MSIIASNRLKCFFNVTGRGWDWDDTKDDFAFKIRCLERIKTDEKKPKDNVIGGVVYLRNFYSVGCDSCESGGSCVYERYGGRDEKK